MFPFRTDVDGGGIIPVAVHQIQTASSDRTWVGCSPFFIIISIRYLLMCPIHYNLARITRDHGFKPSFKIVNRNPVGNEWRQVEATFHKGDHFVPGFKHLTTVNFVQIYTGRLSAIRSIGC